MAGKVWAQGANPYDPIYVETGRALIETGNVPQLWVYPPTWWLIAVPLADMGLAEANLIWNVASAIMLALASALLVAALLHTFPRILDRINALTGGHAPFLALFSLHFLALATLEGSAILLSAGQTTAFALFGAGLLMFGAARRQSVWVVLGVAILLLKPQFGLGLAGVLFLFAPRLRAAILMGGVLTLILSIPASLNSPWVLLEFARNVAGYDAFTIANQPQSMTGLRLLIWEIATLDIGNIATTAIALIIACIASLLVLRRANQFSDGARTWQIAAIMVSSLVAFGPLHVYDFVLVTLPVLLLLVGRGVFLWIGAAGWALIWRSENLAALTGFHADDIDIFAGSRLATYGAIIVFAAVLGAAFSLARDDEAASR